MPQTDLAVGRIAFLGATMAVIVAAAALIAIALEDLLPVPTPVDIIGSTPLPAAAAIPARLLSAPQPVLSQELEQGRERLQHSGWVNEQQGIAHIPIEAAMALLVERSNQPPASQPTPEDEP